MARMFRIPIEIAKFVVFKRLKYCGVRAYCAAQPITFLGGIIMKRQSILLVVTMAFLLFPMASQNAEAYMHFNDGQTHDIDYIIYDGIYVQGDTFGNPTTVNLLPGGGSIMDVASSKNSRVMVSGGSIADSLVASWNSYVTFSDGSIGNQLYAFDSSQVTVSGGTIGDTINSYGGLITISGGSIGTDLIAGLNGADRGVVIIKGFNFAVDGTPVGYGELHSVLGGVWAMEPDRRLTGTLLNGDQIDNNFYVNEGSRIILTPVPGAFILGSIGIALAGMKLRRRREL